MKNHLFTLKTAKFFKKILLALCGIMLLAGNLQAQSFTQLQVAAAIASGTPITGGNITIPAMSVQNQNAGAAGTLTIIATGDVTIGNLDLSGIDGNPVNFTTVSS